MAAGWAGPMGSSDQGHEGSEEQSAEALPAQPLPWALDISSQAQLVYYGINTM